MSGKGRGNQGKKEAIAKAKRSGKVQKKGKSRVQKLRKFFKPSFHRPRTQNQRRQPLFPKRAIQRTPALDEFSIIRYPLTTEHAMKKIEMNNTLVFIVDRKASKSMIKQAIWKLYEIKALKVNTLITPKAAKKAYVRLEPDFDALDVANKIGII
mmetsp:Transcript_13193/g.14627  ORF Transcript_13193/g.14627 Transcript_13193/m.14627 type:complete len:154 (+) Transcript_13193:65-526(+)